MALRLEGSKHSSPVCESVSGDGLSVSGCVPVPVSGCVPVPVSGCDPVPVSGCVPVSVVPVSGCTIPFLKASTISKTFSSTVILSGL